MKTKIVILLVALSAVAGVKAQVPPDTTAVVLVQDSAYIAT